MKALRTARVGTRPSSVRGTVLSGAEFNEKHDRGTGGRFASKPGGEKPLTKGAAALKTSGVSLDDSIEVLSSRVRAYKGVATVRQFVDRHPQGAAYALRKLAADHKKGVIGFKGKTEVPTATPAMSKPVAKPAAPARKDGSWAGTSTRRDISGDEFFISPQALQQGLFKNEAEARSAAEALLAGVPKSEKLKITWVESSSNSVGLIATNGSRSITVSRRFTKTDGGWTAKHQLFQLPRKYQGGGNARAMLRSSVEQYDAMGVTRIETHANINVGGYAWSRLGFAPDNPAAIRQALEKAAGKAPRSAKGKAVKQILASSSDDDLMFNLSRATGPDGERLGRKILGPKTEWNGHLDLKNARHRERLNESFG